MFLPIGDEPNPRGTPVVNYLLIGINVAVFVFVSWPLTMHAVDHNDPAVWDYLRVMGDGTRFTDSVLLQQLSAYDLFIFDHGFRPDRPSFSTLVAAMFLHSGWLHLLGNMLFLYIFGDNVELHLGPGRYALVYLLTGTAATLFYMLFRLDSAVPLVGASGAISGVLGCYFVWFPRNRVRVLMVLIFFIDVVLIPARWVLGFYVIAENLLPFLMSHGGGGGVAYGAHLGGFFGGAGFAWLMRRWQFERGGGGEPVQAAWYGRASSFEIAAVPRFREALADRRFDDAVREFAHMGLAERDKLNDDEIFALADWLTEQRSYGPALAILQRFIAQHPLSATLDRAHLRAGLVLWRGLNRGTAAYQHLQAVFDFHPSPNVEQVARAALAEIEARQRPS